MRANICSVCNVIWYNIPDVPKSGFRLRSTLNLGRGLSGVETRLAGTLLTRKSLNHWGITVTNLIGLVALDFILLSSG
jgi:hypothetical protein